MSLVKSLVVTGSSTAIVSGVLTDAALVAILQQDSHLQTVSIVVGIVTGLVAVVSSIFYMGTRYGEWTKSNESVREMLENLQKAEEETGNAVLRVEHEVGSRVERIERALIAAGILDGEGRPVPLRSRAGGGTLPEPNGGQ